MGGWGVVRGQRVCVCPSTADVGCVGVSLCVPFSLSLSLYPGLTN